MAAVFVFLVCGSTFLAEISPVEFRGAIVGTSIVLIDIAAVLAAGVNFGLHKHVGKLSYQVPLALQILFPVLLALGLFFIYDSPSSFLVKGNDSKALESLRSVRQGYTEAEIAQELAVLEAQAALRQEEINVPWTAMFKGVNLRRTFVSLSIGMMQQLSGIAFATNYATVFLSQIGGTLDPYVLVLCLNVLSVVGAVAGLFLVELVGRRVLALSTFSVLLAFNIVIAAMGFLDPVTNPAVPKVIAAFSLMFGFFYAAGFGPLTYVVSAEIPTARLKNKTSSFTFLSIFAFSTVVAYVLPYISNPDA